ncbi:hypothetical protein BDR22DRAFT_4945 [Usnea florida]
MFLTLAALARIIRSVKFYRGTREHPMEADDAHEDQPMITTAPSVPGLQLELMPPGWELRFADDGRVYFADHNRKTTTWLDPRTGEALKFYLPKGWERDQTEEGKTYFIDRNTDTTTWVDPRRWGAGISSFGLPKRWEIRATERGITYFVDHHTDTTTWDDPRTFITQAQEDSIPKPDDLPSGMGSGETEKGGTMSEGPKSPNRPVASSPVRAKL